VLVHCRRPHRRVHLCVQELSKPLCTTPVHNAAICRCQPGVGIGVLVPCLVLLPTAAYRRGLKHLYPERCCCFFASAAVLWLGYAFRRLSALRGASWAVALPALRPLAVYYCAVSPFVGGLALHKGSCTPAVSTLCGTTGGSAAVVSRGDNLSVYQAQGSGVRLAPPQPRAWFCKHTLA
jgi:hypothetical protein